MQRISLSTIIDNRNRKTELNSYKRKLIIEANSLNVDATEMQKFYEIPESTIKIIIRRISQRNNDANKPRFEKPSKMRFRDKRYIIKIARNESKINYTDFILRAKIQCNRFIVYRILKNYELIN